MRINSVGFSAKPLSLSLYDTVCDAKMKSNKLYEREREWQMKGHGAHF